MDGFEADNINAPRALVVLQEIFGVKAHMRLVSERLAGFGYHILSPALFDRAERHAELGYENADRDKGAGLRASIPADAVLADIAATAAAFGNKAVGVIGYCWGGSLAELAELRSLAFFAEHLR